MKCPKCHFEQGDSEFECLRCGVIFSKLDGFTPVKTKEASRPQASSGPYPQESTELINGLDNRKSPEKAPIQRSQQLKHRGARRPVNRKQVTPAAPPLPHNKPGAGPSIPNHEQDDPEHPSEIPGDPEPRTMDKTAWIILGVSVFFSLALMYFPLMKHIFMTFTTLVHEMGHTIFGWLFAYPSLPAFDIRYGGGVTMTMKRSAPLLLLIYAALLGLIFIYRNNLLTVSILVCLIVLHGVLSYGSGHDVLILFMGHGTELLIAMIFIYRALSSAAVVHTVERPLYGIIGFFIFFSDISFAYKLYSSHIERHFYERAKGGGHWMDFSRISEDYLHVSLESVALFFLLVCVLTPIFGYLMFRYQEYLRQIITRIFSTSPTRASN